MALLANLVLTLLSLWMVVALYRPYRNRAYPHALWYATGLFLIALAAFTEVYRAFVGGVPTALWWLYWIAASASVGFLGVGSAYLLSPRFGRPILIGAALLNLWLIAAVITTAGPAPHMIIATSFAKAPTVHIKLPFLIQNIAGSLLILGGALWSFLRRRGWYNLLIALGTLVFGAGGSASGLLAFSDLFYFTQTAGIAILYLGVSLALRPPTTAQRAR